LEVEALECREVPTVFSSSILANFNGSPIPAGDDIWFNSEFKVGGLAPTATSVTLNFTGQTISFTANGTSYSVAVPDATITLAKSTTTATTSFNATTDSWTTSLPLPFGGNAFLSGVEFPVGTALPGGIKSVTWSGSFSTSTAPVQVSWQWGGAVYTSINSDYNALEVKPLDGPGTIYNNGDHAGTPEGNKSSTAPGATGNGGNNWTGNLSPGMNVNLNATASAAQLYPFASSNPLTSIAFNESDVLVAANIDTTNGLFDVWYSDEHALSLGVNQVNVVTSSGTTSTSYPLATMSGNPSSATNPALGVLPTTANPNYGVDTSGRPISPELYITDTTTNTSSLIGDWQYGGTGYAPSAVYGTWKGVTETINNTTATPTVTVTPNVDPVKNGWNLGPGSDAPPAGSANQGYGAEIQWNLNTLAAEGILLPGHNYRFYVMVHDGDQNKSGGDAGQAAFNEISPITQQASATLSGSVTQHVINGDTVDSSPQGGTTVELINSLGVVVQTTTTLPDGTFTFSGVSAGTYSIVVVPPQTVQVNGTNFNLATGSGSGTFATAGSLDGNSSGVANSSGLEIDSIVVSTNTDIGTGYGFTLAYS
jgi:hypothetical protein